jgi:hypothetical protein
LVNAVEVYSRSSTVRPRKTNGWDRNFCSASRSPRRGRNTVAGVPDAKTVRAQLKVCTSKDQEVDGRCAPPKDDETKSENPGPQKPGVLSALTPCVPAEAP